MSGKNPQHCRDAKSSRRRPRPVLTSRRLHEHDKVFNKVTEGTPPSLSDARRTSNRTDIERSMG